jgi:hypothetical protein
VFDPKVALPLVCEPPKPAAQALQRGRKRRGLASCSRSRRRHARFWNATYPAKHRRSSHTPSSLTELRLRGDAGAGGFPRSNCSTSASAQSQYPADADASAIYFQSGVGKQDVQPAVEIGADMPRVARDLPHLCCVRPPFPSGHSGVLSTAAPHTLVTYHLYVDRIDAHRVCHRKVAMAIPCHMGPRKAKITGRAMSMR